MTQAMALPVKFVAIQKKQTELNELRVIALTHKNFPLETIGKFHVAPELREATLGNLKNHFGFKEFMYVSTCNRVEFVFSLPHYVCPGLTGQIISEFIPSMSQDEVKDIAHKAERYNGPEAAEHLLRVASSLDSVVIGEREIITQLRKSYEESAALQMAGDDLRMVNRQCVKTAKEIFTHTDLSKKPVSVVSLAWQEFQERNFDKNARIVLIGAGQIIRNFCKFLFENGYTNLVIANRTVSKAQELVDSFGGKAIALDQLKNVGTFNALVSCTASENAVVDAALYQAMVGEDSTTKLVIDLALPADIDASVIETQNIEYVGMKHIQEMASANIKFREQALVACEPLIEAGMREFERSYSERKIELAMKSIPETIKDIKQTALGSVFAKDLEMLDENSKEVIEKILTYMEKKYISIPMKMAKEVLMDAVSKN
jgi:glutamyl-tRNA reductase